MKREERETERNRERKNINEQCRILSIIYLFTCALDQFAMLHLQLQIEQAQLQLEGMKLVKEQQKSCDWCRRANLHIGYLYLTEENVSVSMTVSSVASSKNNPRSHASRNSGAQSRKGFNSSNISRVQSKVSGKGPYKQASNHM